MKKEYHEEGDITQLGGLIVKTGKGYLSTHNNSKNKIKLQLTYVHRIFLYHNELSYYMKIF